MVDENPRSKSPSSSTTESIKAEATEQASRLAGSVKDEAKRYEKDLRSGVAERAESLAAGLRKAGSEIDPNSSVATLFDRAADAVSGLADSLNATDPREMVEEVRSDLVRKEVTLAKAELRQNLNRAGTGLGMIVAAAVLGELTDDDGDKAASPENLQKTPGEAKTVSGPAQLGKTPSSKA
ncbi:hypothetical protein PLESTB_001829200 [Pleodorina starrii]|uniref:Uncharacterized protein n=1 Tax=Pleodorina starrii TaxID=330485 RepID=A0A9W6C203_9CHLO|nr:hypothetical protein PLESTB_001829200 [Pleodorina starrii]